MKNILLFSERFKPQQEFIEFTQKMGYSNYRSMDCRLDEHVIEFVEQRLEKYFEYRFYKGVASREVMSGFLGVCYIQEVDTSKTWTILKEPPLNCYETRNIKLTGMYEDIYYVDITQVDNNFIKIKYTNR